MGWMMTSSIAIITYDNNINISRRPSTSGSISCTEESTSRSSRSVKRIGCYRRRSRRRGGPSTTVRLSKLTVAVSAVVSKRRSVSPTAATNRPTRSSISRLMNLNASKSTSRISPTPTEGRSPKQLRPSAGHVFSQFGYGSSRIEQAANQESDLHSASGD